MGDTKIEWTDKTWNPVRGCSRVSEGCRNCYAEAVAARFSGPGQAYEGLATRTASGPRWTGDVRLVEEHLEDPLRWKKPCRIFVNSMSDLFHEKIRTADLMTMFAVMLDAKQHTYQILTKRPERMCRVLSEWAKKDGHGLPPHIWLGVSVEDQKTADERLPWLLRTPAQVRWVSYEPALGPVDFRQNQPHQIANGGYRPVIDDLDWIVVGGESGPGARPFNIQWARDTIAQCKAAGVACFVKQLGANVNGGFADFKILLNNRKGGEITEWPTELQVREYPTI